METKLKNEIKKIIEEQIKAIQEKLPALKDQTKPISPDNAIGRLSRMEAISERSVNEATYRQAKRRLELLEVTQDRIDEEDYGQCLECGEEINLKRLKTLPESTLCMACLKEREN